MKKNTKSTAAVIACTYRSLGFKVSYKLASSSVLLLVHLNNHKQVVLDCGKTGWVQIYLCIDGKAIAKSDAKYHGASKAMEALAFIK